MYEELLNKTSELRELPYIDDAYLDEEDADEGYVHIHLEIKEEYLGKLLAEISNDNKVEYGY